MTLSIKGGGGIINEVPSVTNLRVTAFETKTIDIEYKVEDIELTICRHYLLLNGAKTEITKQVGYESSTNVFRYQITGLEMGRTYTIQIVASDGHDEGLSQAVQQATKNVIIYGVRVMENNSNPNTCCTYIEEAVGTQVANNTSLGGWANKFPYNKIRMVGFKNGKVVKAINPNNKTKYVDGSSVPTDVDVMIEIPKVYWKFTSISNGYEMRIANYKIDSSYDCYAHKVGGVEKDYIYVGAYLGYVEGNKLRSRSGVSPTVNTTLTSFRNYAHNVGSGYQQFNWFTLILLQNLYLLAYKNLNSQQALGMGVCNGNNKVNTGGTNTKGFIYGSSNQWQQVCFLGIEDLYANIEQWIDGMFYNGAYQVLVTPDNRTFNDNGSGYKAVCTGSSGGGKISKVTHTNESGFLPKEFQGSYTTYYCDGGCTYSNYVSRLGGTRGATLDAGIYRLYMNLAASDRTESLGSRLCYLG